MIRKVAASEFEKCAVKIGRRVLIDRNRFDAVLNGTKITATTATDYATFKELAAETTFTETALRQMFYRSEKARKEGK